MQPARYLGRNLAAKKLRVTRDILDLCDHKPQRYEAEKAKEYRKANERIQKAVKKAKKGLDRYSVRED